MQVRTINKKQYKPTYSKAELNRKIKDAITRSAPRLAKEIQPVMALRKHHWAFAESKDGIPSIKEIEECCLSLARHLDSDNKYTTTGGIEVSWDMIEDDLIEVSVAYKIDITKWLKVKYNGNSNTD